MISLSFTAKKHTVVLALAYVLFALTLACDGLVSEKDIDIITSDPQPTVLPTVDINAVEVESSPRNLGTENRAEEGIKKKFNTTLDYKEHLPETVSSFTITSTLCNNEQGPNCTKLRLGDDYLTTSVPAKV